MIGPLDLEQLGFTSGAHLLVSRALRTLPSGGQLRVVGTDPALGVHLRAWCRSTGHGFAVDPAGGFQVERGRADEQRWAGAQRAGGPGSDGIVRRPPAHWVSPRVAHLWKPVDRPHPSTSTTVTWSGQT
ncbi:MAG: sulfurtransferase TusA family protein [Pseudonocardiaceae bacterium]